MPCSVLRTWISEEELAVGGEHQSGSTTPKKRQRWFYVFPRALHNSPMTLNSSFSTAWYPGENVNNYSNIQHSYKRSPCSDVTFICQIEGALVFAPLVLQEDVVKAGVGLRDLEQKGQLYRHGDAFCWDGSQTGKQPGYTERQAFAAHVRRIRWKHDEMRTNGEVKGVNLWQQRLCPDFGSWWRWNVLCGLLFPLSFTAFCFFLLLNNPLWIRQICTLMRAWMMRMAVNRPTEPHAVTAAPSEIRVHSFAGTDSVFVRTRPRR